MKQKKLPKELLVYQCDEVEGEPIYAVAVNVDEIPEQHDGVKVGIFTLNREYSFRLRRELK